MKILPDAGSPRPIKEIFDEEEGDSSSHKIDCSSPNTTMPLDNSDNGTDIHKKKKLLETNKKTYQRVKNVLNRNVNTKIIFKGQTLIFWVELRRDSTWFWVMMLCVYICIFYFSILPHQLVLVLFFLYFSI